MKKSIIVLCMVWVGFLFTSDLYPIIDLNDIWPVFAKEKQASIESAVVDGSIFFLKAGSQMHLLLAEGESSAKQPLNYSTAVEYAQKGLEYLEKTLKYYEQVVSLGREAGYAEEVVKKFKTFNYENFFSERFFYCGIIASVKAYFSTGNILGAYQQRVNDIIDMMITLNTIKRKLESQQSLDISLCCRLYERFSASAIFGNYCTITAAEVLSQ